MPMVKATVAGVSGYYVADGGCDCATVPVDYARAAETAGAKLEYYAKRRTATLCDGSKKDIIVGHFVANITLITPAGLVELPNTRIEFMEGPKQGFVLYVGALEESRLGLTSYAKQIEQLAERLQEDAG